MRAPLIGNQQAFRQTWIACIIELVAGHRMLTIGHAVNWKVYHSTRPNCGTEETFVERAVIIHM